MAQRKKKGYSVRSATDGLVNKKVIVGGKNKVIAEADPERAKYFIAMLNLRASGAYSDQENDTITEISIERNRFLVFRQLRRPIDAGE